MSLSQSPALARPGQTSSRWIWTPFLLLCLIGAAVAVRRIVALIAPSPARVPQMAALDSSFASHSGLTLAHIVPALLFVVLLPFWFTQRARRNPQIFRNLTLSLLVLGVIVGLTAIPMSLTPVGGLNETAAALFFDGIFLFSLSRAAVLFFQNRPDLHRTWMMRAIAVLLGIATTRPVMGIFFATQRLTHLQPRQFFGIAFWIGFSVTYIAGELYLRSRRMDSVSA